MVATRAMVNGSPFEHTSLDTIAATPKKSPARKKSPAPKKSATKKKKATPQRRQPQQMGRYNINPDAEERDNDSSSEDERGGIFGVGRSLVKFSTHQPQLENNGMDVPGSNTTSNTRIRVPSIRLGRGRRQRNDELAEQQQQPYEETHYGEAAPKQTLCPNLIKWALVFACFSMLAANHGPPAPPEAVGSDNWPDFAAKMVVMTWNLTTQLGITVAYSVQWMVQSVADDMMAFHHDWKKSKQEHQELEKWAECALRIPDEWNLEYNSNSPSNNQDFYYLVGQSRAVSVATHALDAWQQSAPLLLYFAGAEGVGKSELARQISFRVFGHCLGSENTREDLLEGSVSPVMSLFGRDFAADLGTKTQLYENIIRHVQQHPNGTVVILEEADEMAEGLLSALVQDLSAPSRYTSTEEDRGIPAYDYDATQSLGLRLRRISRKTVFMVTSTVGMNAIGNRIVEYGGTAKVSAPVLDIDLMDYLDQHFSKGSNSGAYQMIGSKFHGIAPFFPVEPPVLKQILAQKASSFRPSPSSGPFIMTEQAIDDLLSEKERVLYRNVRKGAKRKDTTGNARPIVITFSAYGAHILKEGSKLMNIWQAPVKRCLMSTNAEIDKDFGSSQNNVVLDFDVEASEALILACPPKAVETSNVVRGFPMSSVDRRRCKEMCRAVFAV